MSILGGIGRTLSSAAKLVTQPLKTTANLVGNSLETSAKLLGDVVTLNPKAFVEHAAEGIGKQANTLANGVGKQIDNVGGIVGGNLETLGSTAKLASEPFVTAGQILGNNVSGAAGALGHLASGDPLGAVDDTFQTYTRNGRAIADHPKRVLGDIFG